MKGFLLKYVLPPIAWVVLRLIGLTLRVEEVGGEILAKFVREDKPVIFILWHGRILFYPTIIKTGAG